MRKSGFAFLLIFGLSFVVTAQENDDLYYNSSDRKKQKDDRIKELEAELQFLRSEDYTFIEDTSVNEVDPELIGGYEEQAAENRLEYQSAYNSTNQGINSNFGEEPLSFQYEGDLNDQYYYEDGYEDGYYDGQEATVINNYYGNDFRRSRYGGYGYNSFGAPYGYGFGWSVGTYVGIGGGFGSFYFDPFNNWYAYDPWNYNSWNYGYAYNSYWGNPWRRSRAYYGYGYGAYGGYHDGYYYANNTPSKRAKRGVTRGARVNRGGAVVSDNGGRGSGVRNSSSSLSDGRNFSRTQETYLNKSRRSIGRSGTSSILGSRQGITTLNSSQSTGRNIKYSRGSSSAVRNGQNGDIGDSRRSGTANAGTSKSGSLRYGNVRSSGSSSRRAISSNRNKSYGGQRSGSSGSTKNSISVKPKRNSYQPTNSRSSNNSGSLRSSSSRSSGSSLKPSRSTNSSFRSSSSSRSSGSSSRSSGSTRSSSSKSKSSSSRKKN